MVSTFSTRWIWWTTRNFLRSSNLALAMEIFSITFTIGNVRKWNRKRFVWWDEKHRSFECLDVLFRSHYYFNEHLRHHNIRDSMDDVIFFLAAVLFLLFFLTEAKPKFFVRFPTHIHKNKKRLVFRIKIDKTPKLCGIVCIPLESDGVSLPLSSRDVHWWWSSSSSKIDWEVQRDDDFLFFR